MWARFQRSVGLKTSPVSSRPSYSEKDVAVKNWTPSTRRNSSASTISVNSANSVNSVNSPFGITNSNNNNNNGDLFSTATPGYYKPGKQSSLSSFLPTTYTKNEMTKRNNANKVNEIYHTHITSPRLNVITERQSSANYVAPTRGKPGPRKGPSASLQAFQASLGTSPGPIPNNRKTRKARKARKARKTRNH